MPMYSAEDIPIRTEWYDENGYQMKEEAGGLSLLHWCPNTHRHGPMMMRTVKCFQKTAWGKVRQVQSEWRCDGCGMREYEVGY